MSSSSMRTFSNPPIAIKASRMPFSMPLTSADMATRLETPRMMPSIVSRERNLCAQISLKPTMMALAKFTRGPLSELQSRQQCLDDVGWLDTRQLLVQPLMPNTQAFVVEAEQLQDGGVEIANVHGVA